MQQRYCTNGRGQCWHALLSDRNGLLESATDRQVPSGTDVVVGPFGHVIMLQCDPSRASNSMAPREMLSYCCDLIDQAGSSAKLPSFLMSHRTKIRRRSECPPSKKPGSDAADLCRPHWTRTIFLDACWQRTLGTPLEMTSRMLLQLEAVPG